jgi:lipoprotein-anchoring transpeptidase ErfK/SrfK
MLKKIALALPVAALLLSFAPAVLAATPGADTESALVESNKAEEAKIAAALERKKAIAAKLQQVRAEKKKGVKVIDPSPRVGSQVAKRKCGSFLECLFGPRRVPTRGADRSIFGQYASNSGLSTNMSRRTVDWNDSKYPVGSIIVKTPERALYYVSADGEAIRYKVGVGRDGFQWSGQSKIIAKQEWPSWTPPQEMIEREAEKGHEIPPFMEGGPGNPLGARAMYIGGTIYRVHGTNNESSIGGAVSSGCIRMMNADVIDLYKRVKVGSRIYVYQ